MPNPVKGKELEVFQELKEAEVFQPLAEHYIMERAIMVPCADGDQMSDLFEHHRSMCEKVGDGPILLHTLSLNGGALLLPLGSSLNKDLREDLVLLKHVGQALSLKSNVKCIVLYTHAPCGAAALAGLSLVDIIEYLVKAKVRLKHELPTSKVACYFHIHKHDGEEEKKNTYFVSKEKWLKWLGRSENKERAEAWDTYMRIYFPGPKGYAV